VTTPDAPPRSTPEAGPTTPVEHALVARRSAALATTLRATVPAHLHHAVAAAVLELVEHPDESPEASPSAVRRAHAQRRASRALLTALAARWPGADPDLALLLERDVLHVGDVLHGPGGPGTSEAVVTPAGRLAVGGTTYAEPNAAATALVGYRRNGWTFWHRPSPEDGPTSLAVLVSLASNVRGR